MEDDLRAQLTALIQEGSVISTKINEQIGQSTLFSLAKLAAYFMLDDDQWEALQDVEGYVRSLNLPRPIQEIYVSYIGWNRRCNNLFRKCRWRIDERIKDFGRLRKDFGKEIIRKEPRLQLLDVIIKDQVYILQSLLSRPPETRKIAMKKEGWSTRKVVYTSTYIIVSAVVDLLLFPMIGVIGVIGLIGVEAGIILGYPKLEEWLKK